MNLSHKKMLQICRAALFCICSAAIAVLCSCQTLSSKKEQPKEQVDLSKMSPEERANYNAIQRARQRANEKIKLEAANGRQNNPNTEKAEKTSSKDKWYKHLYSTEKRKRLRDDRPVLLEDNTSIFEWRKDSGPRSEKLLKEGRQNNED